MITEVQAWLLDHAAGTIFGSTLLFAIGIGWKLAGNLSFRPPELFFDDYNLFYFSSAGDGALIRGKCKVTHGWLQSNMVNIVLKDDERNRQEFDGRVERRDNIIYIHATEKQVKREEITIVLKIPNAVETTKPWVGIMTGLSVKDVPCATHILLAKRSHWGDKIPDLLPARSLIAADDQPTVVNSTETASTDRSSKAGRPDPSPESPVPAGAAGSDPPCETESEGLYQDSQRARYSVSLLDLIQAGLLQVGDKLQMVWTPRGGERKVFEGRLTAAGEIEVLGKTFASPSNAAVHAMQTAGSDRSTENGWGRWKTACGILLAELREQHLASHRPPA
jgi:hypothetical protein